MIRIGIGIWVCLLTGCSTAPVADFLDWASPGGPAGVRNRGSLPRRDPRPTPRPDLPIDNGSQPPLIDAAQPPLPSPAPSPSTNVTPVPATTPPPGLGSPALPPLPSVPPSSGSVIPPPLDPIPGGGISGKPVDPFPRVSGIRISEPLIDIPGRPRN